MIKKKLRRRHAMRRVLIMAAIVVLALSGVIIAKGFDLRRQNEVYASQQEELQAKIEAEEARSKELDKYDEYTKTTEFAEWYAQEKMGLVYKDDIVFKPAN